MHQLIQEWKGVKQDIQAIESKRARLMDVTYDQAAEMSKVKDQLTFEQRRHTRTRHADQGASI